MFLKECKYIEKKLVRHIQDNLSDSSFSSDASDKECFLINTYVGCFLGYYIHVNTLKV